MTTKLTRAEMEAANEKTFIHIIDSTLAYRWCQDKAGNFRWIPIIAGGGNVLSPEQWDDLEQIVLESALLPHHRGEMEKLLTTRQVDAYEGHDGDIKDALRQLLEETRWIPVSERLPESGPCLVYIDEGFGEFKEKQFIGHYKINYGWWIWVEADWIGRVKVTHWRPLPGAPE